MTPLNKEQLDLIKTDAENGHGAGVGDTLRLVAELEAMKKGQGEPAAWVRASYLRTEHLGYFEASASRFSPAQVPLYRGVIGVTEE